MSDDVEDAPKIKWPREIWAAERREYDQTGLYVFSEHATVCRFEGDTERDLEFHRYVDGDIFDSAEKYWRLRAEKAEAECDEARRRPTHGLFQSLSDEQKQKALSVDQDESFGPDECRFTPAPEAVEDGVAAIAAERQRQKDVEGWTPEHDDQWSDGEIADAAACYALGVDQDMREEGGEVVPINWPWHAKWWKPSDPDRRKNLVRAGALIAAEIDRLDRALVGQGGE